MALTLTTSDDQSLRDPDPAQIASVIAGLPDADDSFAILARDDDEYTFIQAAGGRSGGFTMEHQEGSLTELYRCVLYPLPLEHVVMAFQAWARGDQVWKTAFRWERVELEGP